MKLEIRAAGIRDVPEIKRLTDACFAPGFISVETLETYVLAEGSLFTVATDADRDGAVVSYLHAFMTTLDKALKVIYMQETPERLMQYKGDTPVGVYKTASIDAEYRRFGICSTFVRDLEPVMRVRGAKLILSPAMRTPAGVVPVEGILRGHGFEQIAVIRRPWEDLEPYCPYCGQHHCICDAVIFMKKLDKTGDETPIDIHFP